MTFKSIKAIEKWTFITSQLKCEYIYLKWSLFKFLSLCVEYDMEFHIYVLRIFGFDKVGILRVDFFYHILCECYSPLISPRIPAKKSSKRSIDFNSFFPFVVRFHRLYRKWHTITHFQLPFTTLFCCGVLWGPFHSNRLNYQTKAAYTKAICFECFFFSSQRISWTIPIWKIIGFFLIRP